MNHTASKIIDTALRPLRGLGLRQFAIVRRILGALKPKTAIVHGHTIYLDPTDFAISKEIIAGNYESAEVALVTKLV